MVKVGIEINDEDYREILALEPMVIEPDETYHILFEDLKERGLKKPFMINSDAPTGLVLTLNTFRLSSTNLIERLNKENRRRIRKVGIFKREVLSQAYCICYS